MIDMLIQIPGPIFLLYFGLFSIIGIVFGRFWIRADGSSHYLLPEPTALNPYEMAALQDGPKRVIQTALFNLWHRQLLVTSGKGNHAEVKSLDSSKQRPNGRIEEIIYQFAQITRKPPDFFNNSGLRLSLNPPLKRINQTLEQLHLKRTEAQMTQARWKMWLILFTILGIGLIKLHFGLYYEHPVFWLILFLIIVPMVAFFILKPHPNTRLGHHYQNKLAEHLEGIQAHSDFDLTFSVALFGLSGLAGIAAFEAFGDTFEETISPSGVPGGAGADSGGDGGGSSSGGGCGGCGGGGA
jgi:uncharacterized protein (TIGR04222 family)